MPILIDLMIGLPQQRPGGLLLSILVAVAAAAAALALGVLYAMVCVTARFISLGLQAVLAILRGIPLLLLIFALGQLTSLSLPATGFLALSLYSVSHVGETVRGYLTAYPAALREQAKLLTISPAREWLALRIPWTLQKSLDAVGTHWISLLKDTGALTVLGIGELTTVARLLSEQATTTQWLEVLLAAAALYLIAVLALMRLLTVIRTRLARKGV